MGVASKRLRDYRRVMSEGNPMAAIAKVSSSADDLVRVAPDEKSKARVRNLFGMYHYQRGEPETALAQFSQAYELSGQCEPLCNALILSRKCRAHESLTSLQKAAERSFKNIADGAEKIQLADVLCHTAGDAGDQERVKRYGRASLRMKDQMAGRPVALVDRVRPKFNFYEKSKNVIAFSLFGDNERYLRMAKENMKALPFVYPGWSCRFYVDGSVPQDNISELVSMGASVVVQRKPHDRNTMSGLFWRFEIASDPKVDFFLVRDADSVINIREKVAVDQWISGEKNFHVIRDFYTHSELMLAGLWGGVGGRISNISDEIQQFHRLPGGNVLGSANLDQAFLRSQVWPAVKQEVCIHDSVFHSEGSQDFPSVGLMEPVRHVGQDMNIFRRSGK